MRIFFDLFHKSPSIFNSHRLICIRECDFVHTSIKHSFTLDKYIPKEICSAYSYVVRVYIIYSNIHTTKSKTCNFFNS